MLSRFAFCFAVVCVAAPASAAPPVHVTAFGRLPVTFEKNTGRYDTRVQFLTRTRGSTVFITRTEMVMVLPMKARGERQEARGAATVSPAPSAGRGSGGGGVAARSSLCDQARGDSPPKRAGITDGSPPSPLPPPTQGGGGNGPLTPRGGSPSALSPQPSAVLRMKLVGANAKAVATGLQKQPGIVNYFIGNDPKKWRTRVPTYAKAKLAGVYPGIDVVYYGTEARGKGQEARAGEGRSSRLSPLASCLEYDFVLKPGADPKRIQLAFEGADRIRVADGDLILSTPAGDVRMKRPYAYQTIGGRRVQVACDYMLRQRTATLCVARYDASRPLVLDPVLEYSTYLGGSNSDQCVDVETDHDGAAYVAVNTDSADFPTTSGSFDTSYAGGGSDIVLAKLDPSGSYLEYSTFIGASLQDQVARIAVDVAGAAYITGHTYSGAFPTTPNAYDREKGADQDVIAVKIGPTGADLAYSTFIGGSGSEEGNAIALDGSGAAYITGWASAGFPTTHGAFDTSHNLNRDVFVAKVHPSGDSLVYSTYVGGSQSDTGLGITVGPDGRAYVTGQTQSMLSPSFPTTAGAFDTSGNGNSDAFVLCLDSNGTRLIWSTFLGGSNADEGVAILLMATGTVLVGGNTSSESFPTTVGALDRTLAGASDLFVASITDDGSALVFSTLIGGQGFESAGDMACTVDGAVWVTGSTGSSDFPVLAGALSSTLGGSRDAFIVQMVSNGTRLDYASYLGGSLSEHGASLSVAGGGLVIAGLTDSGDFPTTPGALLRNPIVSANGFVVKMQIGPPRATRLYTIDRSGVASDAVTLRGYLSRTSDAAKLDGKTVDFSVAGTAVGSAVTGATGSTGRADLPWMITDGPETRTILAAFAGDAAYLPSSGTATLTALTTDTKILGYDRAGRITEYTTLRAMLWRPDNTPVRGKTVTFYVDGTAAAATTTNSDGRALVGYVIPDGSGAGSRTIVADWPGDGGYLASSESSTLYVGKAHPYLWLLSKSCPMGGAVSLYAYFRRLDDYQRQSAKPVTFRVDGTWIADVVTGTGADAGIARYTYHTVEPKGVHTIRCHFAGDAWVEAGYGEATLTIY